MTPSEYRREMGTKLEKIAFVMGAQEALAYVLFKNQDKGEDFKQLILAVLSLYQEERKKIEQDSPETWYRQSNDPDAMKEAIALRRDIDSRTFNP